MAPKKQTMALPPGASLVDDTAGGLPPGAEAVPDSPEPRDPQYAGSKLSANPNPPGWLDQVESDVRQGGRRTIIGRGLGLMQGRGDKGYAGLESGVSKETADMIGSPVTGPITTAQGIRDTAKGHYIKGPLKAVSGVLDTLTLPSMMVAGPEAGVAIEAAPSRAWAAKMFESVMGDAHSIPVTMQNTVGDLANTKELADAAGKLPGGVGKFIKRLSPSSSNPGPRAPVTYKEARDIYNNLTSLSAEQKASLSPVMKRQVGQLTAALNKDIAAAADQVGRAGDYYAAMKDYHRASQMHRAAKKMVQVYLPIAGGAVGAAELLHQGKQLLGK